MKQTKNPIQSENAFNQAKQIRTPRYFASLSGAQTMEGEYGMDAAIKMCYWSSQRDADAARVAVCCYEAV